ncbi:cytochrome P450 4c21-like isoform X2 [Coccinella septempunctata]|uniref:cytochrome P450 4c21-like isoform X2 n=1 Tax=Coccinella septempunctata TaxID=41139 RepID=UPI001D076754|nr:cytochrome P450 4c21-like isoform X2 [Coccinella septempunctata]
MIVEILCSLFVLILYLFYTRSSKYRIGDFACAPANFLIGNAFEVASTRRVIPFLHRHLMNYNGLFKFSVGSRAILAASDHKFLEWILKSNKIIAKPEHFEVFKEWLGDGLLTSSGSHWKEHRRILSPAFHFKIIEDFLTVCHRKSEVLVQQLEAELDKDHCDVYPFFAKFTLENIAESSMMIRIDDEENKSEFLDALNIVSEVLVERMINFFYLHDIGFLFHPEKKLYQKSLRVINEFNTSVIKRRREELDRSSSNSLGDDNDNNIYAANKKTAFLDVLLTAVDSNGQPFSDKDIMDEVNTVMLAGYDVVSCALSFILYNLANNPDVQRKAFEEQASLNSDVAFEQITISEINSMKYLEMVIKESMRMHTPVPFVARRVEEDVYYDDKLIPNGTTIILALYSLHHNPESFPEPEIFNPTRFDANSKVPPFAYLPFSAGQRNCIEICHG